MEAESPSAPRRGHGEWSSSTLSSSDCSRAPKDVVLDSAAMELTAYPDVSNMDAATIELGLPNFDTSTLAALIRRVNAEYWDSNSPTISDELYDRLVVALRRLEPEHPVLEELGEGVVKDPMVNVPSMRERLKAAHEELRVLRETRAQLEALQRKYDAYLEEHAEEVAFYEKRADERRAQLEAMERELEALRAARATRVVSDVFELAQVPEGGSRSDAEPMGRVRLGATPRVGDTVLVGEDPFRVLACDFSTDFSIRLHVQAVHLHVHLKDGLEG